MEKLQLCVYFLLLTILGGETAGTTYFTVQSQRWSSYFSTHRMDDDARWGGRVFVFLCYSAVSSSISFITLAISPCFSRVWAYGSETRNRPNICYNLLGIATAAVFLTFQLLIALRAKNWWYLFDGAGVTDYSHQCHALFALALLPWGFLALLTLIAFAALFQRFFG